MRNPIYKRLPRELWRNKGKYFSVFFVFTLLIALVSGFYIIQDRVMEVYEDNLVKAKVEDGRIFTAMPLTKDQEEHFKSQVDAFEDQSFYQYKTGLKQICFYGPRVKMNLPTFYEGREPKKKGEVSVERIFAKNNDIKLGDTVTYGKDFKVVGIHATPDFSTLLKNQTDLIMDTNHFEILLLSQEEYEDFQVGSLNPLYVYQKKTQDPKKFQEDLVEDLVQEGVFVRDAMTRDQNQQISYFLEDAGQDEPMMRILFLLILVLFAFLFGVVTKTTIEEEAPVIGTLLASGYTRRELGGYFLSIPILVTLPASLLGNLLAYTWFKDYFKDMYYSSYSLAPYSPAFNGRAFLLTTVLPFLLILLINGILIYKYLRRTPVQFLRGYLKKRKTKWRVDLKRGSFLHRYRIRNLLYNKESYLVLFLGILFANLILTFGLSFRPLFQNYLDGLGNSLPKEYQILRKEPVREEENRFALYKAETVNAYTKEDLDLMVFGMSDDRTVYQDYDLKPEGKTLVGYANKGLLEKTKTKLGDQLSIKDLQTGKSLNILIRGITDYEAGPVLITDAKAWQEKLDLPKIYFGYFSDEEPKDADKTLSVLSRDEMKEVGKQIFNHFNKMIPMFFGASIAVYWVVLLMLIKSILNRSKRSMEYLQIFGYTAKEIRKIYIHQTTHFFIIGLLLSLPLVDVLVKRFIFYALLGFSGYLEPVINPIHYLYVFAFGMVTYGLVVLVVSLSASKTSDYSQAGKELTM